MGKGSKVTTDAIPIYNKNRDLVGLGYIVEGEEDRGIQVKRMFTHDRIQSLKDEVELRLKIYVTTKEEAIMEIVRRIQ